MLIAVVLFASGCAGPAEEVENETGEVVEEVTEEAGSIVEEAEDIAGENETEAAPDKNIIQTAEDAGSFTTLITAIKAAGLEETLSGEGPFTVFAPTDDAFNALPAGTLDSLLEDQEALTRVLTYHVASGKYMAADVLKMTSIKTLEGSELPVNTTDGVKVGDANVTMTDIETSNGVIHVIDKVLIPPE
ncbi:fasciclin domain-containing protein [Methanosarcina sp.]|mgnify:CR=1 FL=1|uniref:fasciclin domain-containing protein n=1 Tax=Methanosarcina sp. TaxID=2213 RepID=UPI002BAB03BE|nr:fasciclin domain-containing protein [Methanosarcina sp.]HOW14701.1 fasciclin domain-containing protein [Methanosarcina sp.]